MKPKKGDFIISDDEIWLITKTYRQGLTRLYNVEPLTHKAETIEVYNWMAGAYEKYTTGGPIKGITLSYLRHLGKIVPKEKAGYAIKVLFGKNKR